MELDEFFKNNKDKKNALKKIIQELDKKDNQTNKSN
ncbi:hypothetical protein KCTC32420_00466 [Aequorivita nionensis]